MNVFVLCTGRCGSVTFARACEHLSNYSVGHESRTNFTAPTRLDFPDNHIEVDLRLMWYFGLLEEEHGQHAFYVHLTRDPEKVAASYLRKFQRKGAGLARAWYELMRHPVPDYMGACMFDMVTILTANIRGYLRDKDHMTIDIDSAAKAFPSFCERIGAQGDIGAACREFSVHYNAGPRLVKEPA